MINAAKYVPSAIAPSIALGLTVLSQRTSLKQNIGVTLESNGQSFLMADRTMRFYPLKQEEAKQNEIVSDSIIYENKVDLSGGPITAESIAFTVLPNISELDGKQIVNIEVELGTHFYGGGENTCGLCLNNKSFITWNHDAYSYNSTYVNLYQSHPYIMAVRRDGSSFGVIADTTYPLQFIMTDTNLKIQNYGLFEKSWDWTMSSEDEESRPFSVTIFEGKSPQEVVKKLAKLTGKMELPPKWSIGYHQCRWSYFPDNEALRVAKTFREKKIPCDVIWFDIHYMNDYRVFTFDKKTFPNPKKLNDELHEMGFHTVWMIDPGVKKEEGYFVHDQCVSNNLAILKSKDSKLPADGCVWPGPCVFPDFSLEATDKWWQTLYKDFMAYGIDGVWNDMNEPAVFDTPNKTLPLDAYHQGMGGGEHLKFHNVYGVLMIKSSKEGILKANPTKRPFVLSRASFLGGQRYGATWTGDNGSTWEHLKLSIPMIANLGLSGQPFSGPDIGGFFDDADAELFSRWMGFGAFLPFSRGHTHHESVSHEPWCFGQRTEDISRIAINRRYKLLPYYYTQFYNSSVTGIPVLQPTFFMDPTDLSLRKESDSFLIGKNLLIIVHTEKGDDMNINPTLCNHPNWHDLKLDEELDTHLPILKIREGSIIPTQEEGHQFVSDLRHQDMSIHLCVCLDNNGTAKGKLYEDEGDGFEYRSGKFCLMNFNATQDNDEITLSVTHKGDYNMPLLWKITMTIVNRDDKQFTYKIVHH